jgi:hypothetical protein
MQARRAKHILIEQCEYPLLQLKLNNNTIATNNIKVNDYHKEKNTLPTNKIHDYMKKEQQRPEIQ